MQGMLKNRSSTTQGVDMYKVDINLKEVESYLFEANNEAGEYEIWFTLDETNRKWGLEEEHLVIGRVHDHERNVDLDVSGLEARRIIQANLTQLLAEADEIVDNVRCLV